MVSLTYTCTFAVHVANYREIVNYGLDIFVRLCVCGYMRMVWLCALAVTGQIRASTGKAQLLIAQRFRQFRGLVDDCEFRTGARETTCDDLQGFWGMVYVQVCVLVDFCCVGSRRCVLRHKHQPKAALIHFFCTLC